MKRILLVFACLLAAASAKASHIVGGEFEWVFKGVHPATGQHRFTLSMILYFDVRFGSPAALDQYVDVRVFRKRDNMIMINQIRMNLAEISRVQYKRPVCATQNGSLVTDRIFYTYMVNGVQAEILLNPGLYDDPEGYYISWERCCRNYNITNIYSEPPDGLGGRYAGQTFYMEFPPLIRNSQPFYNSSPRLFRPLSDYACPDRLYTVDFGGVDPDGDSLVYTMVIPLNTKTGDAIPEPERLPRPGPYPRVNYRSPFSASNIMSGAPDLAISKSGILSVIPTRPGLYVFAVRCDEYRDGQKIGEIRRDFQLLVLSDCPPASPPVVEGKRRNQTEYVRNQLQVAFANNDVGEERCVDIRVSDPDAATQDEDIEILAVAVNFQNENLSEILPEVPRAVLSDGNPQTFAICFPQCPYTPNDVFVVDIIVLNESCGGALMDTIRVEVNAEMPPNATPKWTPSEVNATVTEGGTPFKVTFTGTDADNDELEIIPPPLAADFAKYGLNWTVTDVAPGRVEAELTWNTECDLYDFSVHREFDFIFQLNDIDQCDITPNDTLHFDLKRRIPDFHDPLIEYEPDKPRQKINLSQKLYSTLQFNTLISDEDNDKLEVTGVGKDFDLPLYGGIYPDRTLTGNTSVPTSAPFSWYLNCDKIDLDQKDTFDFYLIVTDKENLCGYYLADTLDIRLKVLPPDNNAPHLTINGESEDVEVSILLGDELNIPLVGTDADVVPRDVLTMELMSASGDILPEGFTFTTEEPSQSPITGTLSWKPGCEIFLNGVYENSYRFKFRVTDDRCFAPKFDTLSMVLTIKDRVADDDFLPPNVITPNHSDDLNSFFAMVRLVDGNLVNILPIDNCSGRFRNIVIMNRWGREVFTSSDRDFRWYAEGEPSGVYYYQLNYTNREYKGLISVLRGGESELNR